MKKISKILRAITVMLILSTMGVSACETAYEDVSIRDYYGSSVSYVTSKGYCKVEGHTFAVYQAVTNHDLKNSFLKEYVEDNYETVSREGLAIILKHYIDNNGFAYRQTDKKDFIDEANISGRAKDAVHFLYKADILHDNGQRLFVPQANITRGEFSMIIMTMFESKMNY